ncbi:Sensitive to high expression protein 9 [Venustampulla echinocandica]|uniref:Sensitive to high expression protein 9, mitochondrial n=1 Tax=Venustampulla echinocandica TaxID=2656787 RepID=A0A370TWR5_9HELO|nr:Sensitive to high expression protein 9 [Venustampulla echinocandica]RDL39959.1 Sensitive to high expression protein 9 [Venustampulla echinocandica]
MQIRRYADLPNQTSNPPPPPPPRAQTQETPSTSQSKSNPPEEDPSDLPSAEDGRRSALTKRFSHVMDHLQGNLFIASQRINDLTGYSGIEALKSKITALEKQLQEAQESVRSSRIVYKTTIADRASTQREVTGLLARKDTWTPVDLERFTALYRMDHSNEQAVQEAATRLADAEREAEHAASKLSSSILSRYHEEQIWSDKIRRMSTWGTWGLMGVNVLLFLVFQFGFEPWRRRRLVHGFEEKVRQALDQEKLANAERRDAERQAEVPLDGIVASGVQRLEEELGNTDIARNELGQPGIDVSDEAAALDVAELHVPRSAMRFTKPETWKATAQDLVSERIVQMRKRDITIIALEGAATGATIVAIIATLLRPS